MNCFKCLIRNLEEEDVAKIKYVFKHDFKIHTGDVDDYARYMKMVCKYAMYMSDSKDMINTFLLIAKKFCGFSKDSISLRAGESVKHLYDNVYDRFTANEKNAKISVCNDFSIFSDDKSIHELWETDIKKENLPRVLVCTEGSLEEFKRYVLGVLMEDVNTMKLRLESAEHQSRYLNSKNYCAVAIIAFNNLTQILVYAINCYSNMPNCRYVPYDWIYINSGLGDVDRELKSCGYMEVS